MMRMSSHRGRVVRRGTAAPSTPLVFMNPPCWSFPRPMSHRSAPTPLRQLWMVGPCYANCARLNRLPKQLKAPRCRLPSANC